VTDQVLHPYKTTGGITVLPIVIFMAEAGRQEILDRTVADVCQQLVHAHAEQYDASRLSLYMTSRR
jgi:hypothetical protein